MSTDSIQVGIGEIKYTKPPNILKTSGLGSCVGVVIYDSVTKQAGMAHIMLPEQFSNDGKQINAGKYADTAIPILINTLVQNGACKNRLLAKLAGGSAMFPGSASSISKIGIRNVEKTKKLLLLNKITLVSEDVGGNKGRTVVFYTDTQKLHIYKALEEVKAI